MSVFNKSTKSSDVVTNLAGGKAYKRKNDYAEFLSIVMNCLNNSDKYYKTNKQIISDLYVILDKLDLKFIAQATIYLRTELGFRYITKILADYLIKNAKGTNYLKNTLIKSFVRVDDMTDQFALSGRSNSLRRAIKECFETKFNLYHFKKYSASKSEVKLKDLVKLTRPNPNRFSFDKQGLDDVFKAIIEDRLPNINTAQTINASGKGYNSENLKDLGYMALIKNVAKIINESPELFDDVIARIKDKNQIKKSMILPFRFFDCMKIVNGLIMDSFKKRELLNTLFEAMCYSKENLEFNGKLALCLDESGSMEGRPFEYGKVLTSILMGDNSVAYTWANKCEEVTKSAYEFLMTHNANGGGTYVEEPLKKLLLTKTYVDCVIIFTDMQLYSNDSYNATINKFINEYRKNVNSNAKVVCWNLAPYGGSTPIKFNKDVVEINSCSDSLIPYIGKILENPNYIIDKIKSIQI